MATVIRFARHGCKKRPYFRIVVQDKRSPRDGRFIDHIGAYDPIKGESSVTIERARLEYWLSCGAQMSDSVKNRLKSKMAESASSEVVAAPVIKAAAGAKRSAEAK